MRPLLLTIGLLAVGPGPSRADEAGPSSYPGGSWVRVSDARRATQQVATAIREITQSPIPLTPNLQQTLSNPTVPGADVTLDAAELKIQTFVDQRRQTIVDERSAAIERFLDARFAAKRAYTRALADKESHSLTALKLRESIEWADRQIGFHRAEIAKHDEAKATLAQRAEEAERSFHYIYTNIHHFYVAGAVGYCADKVLNRADIQSLSLALRRVADKVVNEAGYGGYIEEVRTLSASHGSSGADQRTERSINRIDRSMLLFPLGEHFPEAFDITRAHGADQLPRVVGGLAVFLHPVAAQPQLAGFFEKTGDAVPKTATEGTQPGEVAERGRWQADCKLHGFLLANADGRLTDPCAGSSESLPKEICEHQRFRAFLTQVLASEHARVNEMVQRVRQRQKAADVEGWRRSVRDYGREMASFQTLIAERDDKIVALGHQIERLKTHASGRRALTQAWTQACQARVQSGTRAAASLKALAQKGRKLRIIFFTQASRWSEHSDIQHRAQDALDQASQQARAAYHMWIEKGVWGSDATPQISVATDVSGGHSDLERFQVIYGARQPGPDPVYWVQLAFEFALEVETDRYLPGAGVLTQAVDEPRLVWNVSEQRAYWIPKTPAVTWNDARQKATEIAGARPMGTDRWRLLGIDERSHLRRLCQQIDAIRQADVCYCAWTDRAYDRTHADGHHRVWGSAHHAIRLEGDRALVEPMVDSNACGIVLTAEVAATSAADPCRPLPDEPE